MRDYHVGKREGLLVGVQSLSLNILSDNSPKQPTMDKGGGVLSKEISVLSVGGGYEEIIWFFQLS